MTYAVLQRAEAKARTMFGAESYPITIVELRLVQKDLNDALSEDEAARLIDWIAMNPTTGDIVQGTNGVRKMRWRCGSKGKRGGLRIIYYFRDLNMPIYLLAIYKKGEKLDLSDREKKMIRQLVDELVDEHAQRRETALAKSVG